MKITSESFREGDAIPPRCAFCKPDPDTHAAFSDNLNPQLSFEKVPGDARSLVLICVDEDVPSKPDDVNQEGRTVPADLPRCAFYHWVMIDIPSGCKGIAEGECSSGVTPGGKIEPAGPPGTRQGMNDYTGWFAKDADMAGDYCGYDGPCPPWNDSLVHHYRFRLYALDVRQLDVHGLFTAQEVIEAMAERILAQAELTGVYSLNPDVAID